MDCSVDKLNIDYLFTTSELENENEANLQTRD